ncbi:MAG: hypothetical protein J2P21_31985 [Chloracidobacterium sp.]|nr:hypothetical protein [Chloracidobacterium sp.]
MAWAAPAQNQINNPSEMNNSQISQEELEKLQEIHELINLLFADMTSRMPQSANPSYMTPGITPNLTPGMTPGMSPGMTPGMMRAMPPTAYTHSMFQYAWGMSPYLRMPGF